MARLRVGRGRVGEIININKHQTTPTSFVVELEGVSPFLAGASGETLANCLPESGLGRGITADVSSTSRSREVVRISTFGWSIG